MKSKFILCLSLLLLLFLSPSQAQTIDDLILMSEQFPPYNFEENGELKGTSIDLMALILKKMNARKTIDDIRMMPWARAYTDLQKRKNTVLFVVTKTDDRENLFKWVGPISQARNVLIAKKDRKVTLQTSADIRKFRICAVRNDAGEQLVMNKTGLKKEEIQGVSFAFLCIRMLQLDRIDLFAYDEHVAKWVIRKEGLEPDRFETAYVLEQGLHYFAFHRETPDHLIHSIQKALDEIKKEGAYDKILNTYLR